MRWLRAVGVLGTVLAVTAAGAPPVWGPLAGAVAVLSRASATGSSAAAADLTSLLLGCCALLLTGAWSWLVLAVVLCTWDALVRAPGCSGEPSLVRPRLVRAFVVTCVGAGVLGAPAAHAAAPVGANATSPVDLVAVSTVAGPVAAERVLSGLPVPDRVTGRPTAPARHPSVEVTPGDTLWGLTADLLPRGAPAGTVAAGWPLLYAANRAVIGDDPGMLRPGQTLQVGPALARLARQLDQALDRGPDRGPDRAAGRAATPSRPDAGGPS